MTIQNIDYNRQSTSSKRRKICQPIKNINTQIAAAYKII